MVLVRDGREERGGKPMRLNDCLASIIIVVVCSAIIRLSPYVKKVMIASTCQDPVYMRWSFWIVSFSFWF